MEKIPIRYIHATPKEPDFSECFVIRTIQDVLAGQDMVQELHRHDFFYMLALTKGTGTHEIDFTPYPVCDHSVFFLRPGQVHQLLLKAGSTGYMIQFRTDFYYSSDKVSHQLLRKASTTNFYRLEAHRFQKIHALLGSVFQECTDRQESYQEAIKASLNIFYIELIRQRNQSPSNPDNLYLQERLEEFVELIETHIATHKQVSHYADRMHLSSYQLNAITKATLGKTCSALITEYAILEAKRYLLATSNQVNQIAYQLGYEDVSYFIRFFRKHTGYSPEAFRNNFR
jgi:AraC-like DNA-binding protein